MKIFLRESVVPECLATVVPNGLEGCVVPSRSVRTVARGAARITAGLANAALANAGLANSVLAQLPLAIAVVDASLRLQYWNEPAAGMFCATPMIAAGMPPFAEILAGVDYLTAQQRERILDFITDQITASECTASETCFRVSFGRNQRIVLQVRGLGSRRWMLIIDDGRGNAAYSQNVARGDAWLDALTGLSNRRHLDEVLHDLIDRSSVSGLSDGADAAALVRAIAAFGVGLAMTTTAEGVETQATSVEADGCTDIQGFFNSRPIPSSEINTMIRQYADSPQIVTVKT